KTFKDIVSNVQVTLPLEQAKVTAKVLEQVMETAKDVEQAKETAKDEAYWKAYKNFEGGHFNTLTEDDDDAGCCVC
ncbi:hypothetical protein A2U01_0091252, partial [Trifolium medium]|nr:hypothetical protein [Trifolium medium]